MTQFSIALMILSPAQDWSSCTPVDVGTCTDWTQFEDSKQVFQKFVPGPRPRCICCVDPCALCLGNMAHACIR